MYRMPTDHDNRVAPADPSRANDYDSFAEAYTAESEAGIINVYYERSAILALAGDGISSPASAPTPRLVN
jgi:hypothetical protein